VDEPNHGMARVISIHSFRGGTGKSNTTANVAACLAKQGKKVGVIDTDIQSPGIHVLFQLAEDEVSHALNDFLFGRCRIDEAAYDVTSRLGGSLPGSIHLIPSSVKTSEITKVLRDGYDVGRLNEGLMSIGDALGLDVLLIDTHPGLNEETLLSIAISDALAIIMRPDQQDYQGTGVTVEVARRLEVPSMHIVVNKAPAQLDFGQLAAKVQTAYDCEVAAILPHSDDLMTLASEGVFSLRYPSHPMTGLYAGVAQALAG
jgi:MinD-like ATPase involved in chromosome partitioning or flagellar assembly